MPVGSFPANGFGLHDVHGKVSEWVEDCWHNSYAWISDKDCGLRVLRGGSWFDFPMYLRSAFRDSEHAHVDLRTASRSVFAVVIMYQWSTINFCFPNDSANRLPGLYRYCKTAMHTQCDSA